MTACKKFYFQSWVNILYIYLKNIIAQLCIFYIRDIQVAYEFSLYTEGRLW